MDQCLCLVVLHPRDRDAHWSPAQDNVGVVGYRVYLDGEMVGESTTLTASIPSLEPGESYTFTIQAGDMAGNWTNNGPSATAETEAIYDPGFRRLSRTQYNATLADLMAPLWAYCDPSQELTIWPCKNPWAAETWQNLLESDTSNVWAFHAQNYPRDERIRAEEELRGGHKRLDNRVLTPMQRPGSSAMTVATIFSKTRVCQWSGGLADDMVLAVQLGQ